MPFVPTGTVPHLQRFGNPKGKENQCEFSDALNVSTSQLPINIPLPSNGLTDMCANLSGKLTERIFKRSQSRNSAKPAPQKRRTKTSITGI